MTLGVGNIVSEAFHEAGHAVMARLLGLSLKRVRIDPAAASGKTCVVWPGARDPRKELRILAGARACMVAFSIATLHDPGGFGDETQIQNILDEIFPDEDEATRESCIAALDDELLKLFESQNVHAFSRRLDALR
jgi:hypothetical protein